MYEALCDNTEMSLPNHLVPKHQREETKEEYKLRVNQAQQKLMEEIEILRLKSDTYGEKIKMIDKEIDNMIIVKYENHPIKKEHLRDQWKERCKKEEIKSSQIWQDKEANMRSNIDTNIIPNSIEQDSNDESRHVTKRTLKNVEDGEQEVLTDNTLAILREHERAYMEELERKMHAEESGEFFDDSALEKIGGNIDKLEKVLGTHNNRNKCANGKRPDARIDSSDDCRRADTAEVPNFEDKIGLRTKIPIPVRKLMRAKRKLNLASHDND